MGTIRVFSIWWFPFIFFMKWQCWCEVLCLINYNHEKSFLPFLWWKDLTIPLIQLEVEKAGKKHKKEMSVLKLQERITTLELEKDDFKQYGRRVSIRIDGVPVEFEETADNVYEKVGEFFREACPDIPVSCIDWAHCIGSEIQVIQK